MRCESRRKRLRIPFVAVHLHTGVDLEIAPIKSIAHRMFDRNANPETFDLVERRHAFKHFQTKFNDGRSVGFIIVNTNSNRVSIAFRNKRSSE